MLYLVVAVLFLFFGLILMAHVLGRAEVQAEKRLKDSSDLEVSISKMDDAISLLTKETLSGVGDPSE